MKKIMKLEKLARAGLLCCSLLCCVVASQADVMMQAFYWDHPVGGTWYNTVNSKVSSWANAGITSVWLPPVQKSQSGPYSMGYDPFDYFDLGEYNQMGTVETRHGSRTELQSLINNIHGNGMKVYADIVINHNAGGNAEANSFTGGTTYTSFMHPHGKFPRSQYDFHPNGYCNNDDGVFASYPDLAHCVPYVQDWLWRRADSVARYYRDTIGFDGWRFDFVRGFGSWVVRDWLNAVGGFGVVEFWDANPTLINNYISGAGGASAFDFPLYYRMRDALSGRNMALLNNAGLVAINPSKAVTFVTNHDTNEIYTNKLLAYAYILTHQGYPTIFYRDYEEWLNKSRLNALISINKNYAVGTKTTLVADSGAYIAQRNGSPGLLVFINGSNSGQSRTVTTRWANTVLQDISGNNHATVTTNGSGQVSVSVGANNYAVWVPSGSSGSTGGTASCSRSSMYLRGSFNSWGSQAMTCSNGLWTGTATFGSGGQFKFDVSANWVTNYGDSNADGVANLGGSNITTSSGTRTITFNDSTLAYTVN